jgi:hypothetical protein
MLKESLIYVNISTYRGSLTITLKMVCKLILCILINPKFKDVVSTHFAIFTFFVRSLGARDDAVCYGNALPARRPRFRLPIWPFRPHCGPGFDWASNRSEYQEYFLGAKAAGA